MALTKRAPVGGGGGAEKPVARRLLNVDEVADRLSVSKDWTYRLIYRGDLFSVKSGRRRLVPETAVEEYIARLTDEAS